MRFGLIGPAYRSQSVNADCQSLVNLYREMLESGQGTSQAALYCTPGLLQLYNLGGAGIRGIITAQGRTFAIAGGGLWELFPLTAVPNKILRGQVVSDGQPVSLASGPTQVLIASAGNLYVYQLVAGTSTNIGGVALAANSLTQIPQYNNGTGYGLLQASVSQVVYGDGFFFALFSNSNQIQASNPLDGSSWQGVSQTAVSVFSDNVLALYFEHRRMWLFGPNNIQPYFDSGNFPFPYDVDQAGFIEQGIAAPFSIAKLDNSLFWLGQDTRGAGIVWRANGYTPMRISTHAIEFEFSTYVTISDAVCYAYQEQGHTFYVMNFPTAQKTWVYDCATQEWHQRGFLDPASGVLKQSRAGFHTFNFGMHLVGDPTTGAIYQQSINILSDFGNPILRQRRAPHISNEQSRIVHSRLELHLETGLGPTAQGNGQPTFFYILDGAGLLRALAMRENGVPQAPLDAVHDVSFAAPLFINDQTNTTSWKITINAIGAIVPILQPVYIDSYPVSLTFVSLLGKQRWSLQLVNLGAGLANIQVTLIGIVGRGPTVTLRFTDDGGHTWSNPYDRDCGQVGAYRTRVIWNRLGQVRDRVYEFSMSDPCQWRIIDGYLTTDEDRQPTSRFSTEMRKRA